MLKHLRANAEPISGVYPATNAAVVIADDCRVAALAFVNGVPQRWSKYELAHWLTGPYARATRLARKHDSQPPPRSLDSSNVDEHGIEALLRSARLNVMTVLENMTLARGEPNQLAFIDTMVSAHYVVPAVMDHRGGWLPVDEPGIRLRTRVLALFAVDALVRPQDYAASLSVCHRCERVGFDESAVGRGYCALHAS